MGGLEIEWVEPAEISLWMASRFINQIVECFNRTGHILNRFEQQYSEPIPDGGQWVSYPLKLDQTAMQLIVNRSMLKKRYLGSSRIKVCSYSNRMFSQRLQDFLS